MLVAIAAPASPQWNTVINSQSSTMFSTPPSTARNAPKPALPTVIKLKWNTMPNAANGSIIKTGIMYSRQ